MTLPQSNPADYSSLQRINPTANQVYQLVDFVVFVKGTYVYFYTLTRDRKIKILWTSMVSLVWKNRDTGKEPTFDSTPLITKEELIYLFTRSPDLSEDSLLQDKNYGSSYIKTDAGARWIALYNYVNRHKMVFEDIDDYVPFPPVNESQHENQVKDYIRKGIEKRKSSTDIEHHSKIKTQKSDLPSTNHGNIQEKQTAQIPTPTPPTQQPPVRSSVVSMRVPPLPSAPPNQHQPAAHGHYCQYTARPPVHRPVHRPPVQTATTATTATTTSEPRLQSQEDFKQRLIASITQALLTENQRTQRQTAEIIIENQYQERKLQETKEELRKTEEELRKIRSLAKKARDMLNEEL